MTEAPLAEAVGNPGGRAGIDPRAMNAIRPNPLVCPPRSSLTCKQRLAYRKPVGDVFKALADPTRRVILDELQERSGQTLFELCVRLTTKHGLGSSRQAISQHLAVLESAGLVITRRQGRYKYHDLDTTPLRTIVERWQIGH